MEKWKDLTYEKLMAMFAETREQQMKTDEQMKKTDKKLGKLAKIVGGTTNNIGSHAEQYFQNVFAKKLSFGGIKYDYMTPNLTYQKGGKTVEFDIALFNGKSVAIIEAKNRIHPEFIKEVVEKKVKQFRNYFPLYKDFDLYFGVAGFSFDKTVSQKAKEYGVGIIRQVGDAVEIDDGNLKVY